MDKIKINPLATYAIIGGILLIFGFYSTTTMYANAITTVTITYATGTIIRDVSYDKSAQGSDSAIKYTTGVNGSGAVVFKMSSSNAFLVNTTLAGSTLGRAIEFNYDNDFVYVATNDKIWKLTDNLANAGSLATAIANTIFKLYYDENTETMYFCTTDSYGTINLNTLSPTTLYTDAGTNGILGCSFDTTNNFAYISGNGIGSPATADIVRINLNTHAIINQVAIVNFYQENCFDDIEDIIWTMEPSATRVVKYDSTLTQITTVTVGTTPRGCAINTDETGRRLYVSNEGTDNISIVDIDANAIINTIASCNIVADRYMDTKRLENTTQTYIPCSANINTILNDNSVSSFVPTPSGVDVFCEIPANFNLLTCVLARGDTTPITGASELVNQSSTNIVCQIGLISCTQDEDGNFTPDNPDIQTNGVGYLLLAISLGIMIGVLWVASDGQLTNIPTFIWFIATLAIVGTLTAFDWIDPTLLVISIIVIVAMATAKAKGVFSDSQLFKGESI